MVPYFKSLVKFFTFSAVSLIVFTSLRPGISSTSFFRSEMRFPFGTFFSSSFLALSLVAFSAFFLFPNLSDLSNSLA